MRRLRYQAGFGNAFQSEAVTGALPTEQNTPNPPPFKLITEQINGTGLTVHRAHNHRVWLYRLRAQILDRPFRAVSDPRHARFVADFRDGVPIPQVMGFNPVTMPSEPTNWLQGLTTFAGAGDPSIRRGAAVHLYAANADMVDTAFSNIDGDLLVVPERGRLHVRTELGRLVVEPGEILIMPRGIRFQVLLPDGEGRGWVGELFDGHFQLPERGPVGANGMADERHFLAPVAEFEDDVRPWRIVVRQGGQLWEATSPHSPFDVVAWHGSYTPFKYDLMRFNSMGSVSWDHVDPSILTVLTCPADTHGRNALDLAVFRGRWDVTEGTFRPPFFHRNSAIEFNGVVKMPQHTGLRQPGTFTYTPYLTPHGITSSGVVNELARTEGRPHRMSDASLWIQFESTYPFRVMPWMLDHPDRDDTYLEGFAGYPDGTLP